MRWRGVMMAMMPGVIAALVFVGGEAGMPDRPHVLTGRHRVVVPWRACGTDAVQSRLARALARNLPPADLAREREILAAMRMAGGERRLERQVIARALARGAEVRQDADPLVFESDELVMASALAGSARFRRLRNASLQPRAPAPVRQPQELVAETPPETANDLLEALREAPRHPPPASVRLQPDPLEEAARFSLVLGEDSFRSAAFLDVYEDHPGALRPLFAGHADDSAFSRRFQALVLDNLRQDLARHVAPVFVDLLTRLEARGYDVDRIDDLLVRSPEELGALAHGELAGLADGLGPSRWRLEAKASSLVARREAGHYVFTLSLPAMDLLLSVRASRVAAGGSGESPRWAPAEALLTGHSFQRVRRCHGPLCFPVPAR